MKTYPTILREVRGTQYVFDCPHCGARHVHSAGDGHRIAHCHNQKSPYLASGYVLKAIRDDDPRTET